MSQEPLSRRHTNYEKGFLPLRCDDPPLFFSGIYWDWFVCPVRMNPHLELSAGREVFSEPWSSGQGGSFIPGNRVISLSSGFGSFDVVE